MKSDIIKNITEQMNSCIERFTKNINNIRTNRVSSKVLEDIKVDYYGLKTPLKELSNITIENFNTLKLSVFDRNMIRIIEKEIFHSKLEINPIVHDNVIRIIIPPLTEERRNKLFKLIQSESEKSRINIRIIRRDANDKLKRFVKDKLISSDAERIIQNEIQDLTDKYINKINDILSKKKIVMMKI
ncbi:ribosome recycling factor [Buchnera aphidicola]|uniref:ribosome recycling factor n=1 Tax=Buchnera aphidicola TaxID=9 RepID=UPI0034648790